MGGIWTYYSWYYKEILIPSTAPVNVTTELTVKEAGSKGDESGQSNEQSKAIELVITAKNPSTRTVYLLPNCWFASGVTIWSKSASEDTWVELSGYANLHTAPSDTAPTHRILEKGAALRAIEGRESWLQVVVPETFETGWIYQPLTTAVAAPPAWLNRIGDQINIRAPTNEGTHFAFEKVSLVAAGPVVSDTIIYPGESLSASYVFYVPAGTYDMLYVHVELPTTTVEDAVDVEWKVSDVAGCVPTFYRIVDGIRGEKIEEAPELELQSAVSMRQLSLWQSKPFPVAPAKTSPAQMP